MTGYFEIKTYCELAGVSENTAYQRRLRGQIPYIMGENGLYYLYFTDDEKPLDGYVSLRSYAAKHGLNLHTLSTAVYEKRFKDDEVVYCRKPNSPCKARHWYIREDAEYPLESTEHRKERTQKFGARMKSKHENACPYEDGYVTLNEWAILNNYTIKTARVYACTGKLPIIHVGKFVYIPKDYVCSKRRKKGAQAQ